MKQHIQGAIMYRDGVWKETDITVEDGILTALSDPCEKITGAFDAKGLYAFPGFVDPHVHLREPGFEEKETMKTGTLAAAHGGFTDVFTMPNLNPVPDTKENLDVQLRAIEKDAVIHVHPLGAISVEEKGHTLSNMEELCDHVIAFSDDGRGVMDDDLMEEAMKKAKKLGKIICAHAEDTTYATGPIHDGDFAKAHNIPGNDPRSEWKQVARDLELVRKTGCSYHVCHVSTKESIELIRKARQEGLDVTCETAPHYLLLNDGDLRDCGDFKMNPPIRTAADQKVLREAFLSGTILSQATDHAPHTAEEKNKGIADSLNGIVGIEIAFPLLYTHFVKTGLLALEDLIERFSGRIRRRFGLPEIAAGSPFDMTFFDLDSEYVIDSSDFLSKGRATPFKGWKVNGKCIRTYVNGSVSYGGSHD